MGVPKRYLTTGQVAEACEVSLGAVKKWIKQGKLKAVQTPGGHFRIPADEFQRFRSTYRFPPTLPEPHRVLIVDDEPKVLGVLVDFLAAHPRGFKLETATDGYEALIKVGAFQPSILILDVVMPMVDGIEVCRRLKAAPETRAIKILGMTAYPDSIPKLLEAGADACLAKPFHLQQVQQELDRLLTVQEA